jgi:Domain of Unknown Function (DUF1080)
MKKILLLIVSITFFTACSETKNMPSTMSSGGDNTLTNAEKNMGWKLLFDGKTTQGWRKYDSTHIGNAWVVDNGTLHLNANQRESWQIKGGGDIVTLSEYDNFHFQLDWKIAKDGNSGIMIYVKEMKKYKWPWETGPEMQVLDNAGHPDSKIIKHRAGDLYDLITSSPEMVKPYMEWNHAEIISNKGALEFYLNGTKVVSTTMWTEQWVKMIKGSKFKDMPDFGTYKLGRIALQDHGDDVWFKNIKIKKL